MEGGKTESLWVATEPFLTREPLDSDIQVEVLVIGAGIGGITTAYLLAEAGLQVVVVDDGPVGSGETSRTTAHLSNAIDDRYYHLEALFGRRAAHLAGQSQTAAIDFIEHLVETLQLDCQFERVDGYLYVEPNESDDELRKELDACRKAGMTNVELVEAVHASGFKSGAALRFSDQAQFHPLKYLNGIAKAFEALGGRIYTGTHVLTSSPPRPKDEREQKHHRQPAVVKTQEGHTILAKHAVFATNSPINDWVVIHTKQAPYRTYAIGYEVERGTLDHALFWDTKDPYHYIRVQPLANRDVIIIGGEDHKTGQVDPSTGGASEDRWRALQSYAEAHLPVSGKPTYEWSGQVMEPVDGLPFFGRNPMDETDTYIITGDSGMGMTNATCGALIIRDLILGRSNPWAELYEPGRISLSAAGEWLKENSNVASEYTSWLGGGSVRSASEIPNGEGAILSDGTDKIASYRDENGELHQFSARCTHLSCVVKWNSIEKTWDCPCHGSRFGIEGQVLNGPAVAPLQRIGELHNS